MKKPLLLTTLALLPLLLGGQTVTREFTIQKKYLNFPVCQKTDRQKVWFLSGSDTLTSAVIRIADREPDYWVYKDVSALRGKTLKLVFAKGGEGIARIFQDDRFPGQDSLYRESLRPQFHFSPIRGWNNDPNGLVWLDGEYHLFFQHNPYEIQWENMTWGHAVSPDLVHWTEIGSALEPDRLGTMFSGSAVIDRENTSGWGKNAMVAAYTADGKGEVQCVAYSLDKGRTFTKYPGNPVAGPDRDPKVFWYEPDRTWIMALYKVAGISLFRSADLKSWTETGHTRGFYECPEFFELPVDGNPAKKLWVMYGGSGTYMLGHFDGKKFSPEFGKYRNTYGAHYAAQTYNNTPDGKRIQIGWGRIESPGMPFNQMMCFPTELTLRSTSEGIRLFSEPVAAIEKLHAKKHDLTGLGLTEANDRLNGISGDLLRIVARLETLDGTRIGIGFRGNSIATMDADELNGVQTPLNDPGSPVFDVEMLIDRTSVETYFQKGRVVFVDALRKPVEAGGLKITGNPGSIRIHKLEVYELNSAWNYQ